MRPCELEVIDDRQTSETQKGRRFDMSGLVGRGRIGASLGKLPSSLFPVGQRLAIEACSCDVFGRLRSHLVHVGCSLDFVHEAVFPRWTFAFDPRPSHSLQRAPINPSAFGCREALFWILGSTAYWHCAGSSERALTGIRVSNTCIGDSGAWTLSSHEILEGRDNGCLLCTAEFFGVCTAVFLFGVLCRALKNRIGSSGAVACDTFVVCRALPNVAAVQWGSPLITRCHLLGVKGQEILQGCLTSFESPDPSIFWGCFAILALPMQYAMQGHFGELLLIGMTSWGPCLSVLLCGTLLQLLLKPLRRRNSSFRQLLWVPLSVGFDVPVQPLALCAQVDRPLLHWHGRPTPKTAAGPRASERLAGTRPRRRSGWRLWSCLLHSLFGSLAHFSRPGLHSLGAVGVLHSAVWTIQAVPCGASIIPFEDASPSDFMPDPLPAGSSGPALPSTATAPGSRLALEDNEWTPGEDGNPSLQPPTMPDLWPSMPPHRYPRQPVPAGTGVVNLPLTAVDEDIVVSGRWLGVIVHAPYYQDRTWAVELRPGSTVQDVMDCLLQLGSDFFDDGIDTIIPVNPPRHCVFLNFLAYPRCIGLLDGCRQVAVIVDASCVGGHYFAAVFPHELGLGQLLAYLQPQLHVDFDQLKVYVGCNPQAADERTPMLLEDGDAITVLPLAGMPPRAFDVRSLLSADATLGRLRDIPRHSYAPGFCLIHQGERWLVHRRYHSNRTPSQAVAFYLDCTEEDLTLSASGDFSDLDLMGEPCCAIIGVARLPPPSSGHTLHSRRLDVFTYLDFRPLGYKPQVHFSHAYQLHIPTLLALYHIILPPDYGLSISGGVVHRDMVLVPAHATLVFRAFPLDERRSVSNQHEGNGDVRAEERPGNDGAAFTPPQRTLPDSQSPLNSSGNRPERSRSPRVHTRTFPYQAKKQQLGIFLPMSDMPKVPSTLCQVAFGSSLWRHWCTADISSAEQRPFWAFACCADSGGLEASGKPQHLEIKLTVLPDLTVSGHDRANISHDEHLRLLLQPFGEGNLPIDIPPDLMPQVVAADEGEDADFFRAMFVIMTPDYYPDIVIIPVRAPATFPEILFELDSVRIAERRRRFAWVSPAQPQPSNAYAVLVALPEWIEDLVAVFDLRTVDGTMFPMIVPSVASREELLVIAGLGADYAADVFVHVSQEALLPGQQVALRTGMSVVVAEPGSDLQVGRTIEDMLLSPEGWDAEAALPMQDGPAFLLLTDEGQARFPLDEERRAETRLDIASHLQYDARLLTLRGVHPRPTDHCSQGWACNAYVVATQRLPRPARREIDPRVVVYDMRPLLLGLTWELTSSTWLPLRALLNRFAHLCPQESHVEVSGGQIATVNGEEGVRLGEPQRLIISIEPDGGSDTSSSGGLSSDNDSDASSSPRPGPPRSPSVARNLERSRSPRPRQNPPPRGPLLPLAMSSPVLQKAGCCGPLPPSSRACLIIYRGRFPASSLTNRRLARNRKPAILRCCATRPLV